MKHLLHFSLIACVSFLYATAANAQGRNMTAKYYVEISFFPGFSNNNDTSAMTGASVADIPPTNKFTLDTRNTFAYVFGGQYLLGFNYNMYTYSEKKNATAAEDSIDKKDTTTVYGPTFGVMSGNWRFIFTYYMGGTRTFKDYSTTLAGAVQADNTVTNSSPSGYQLVIGYSIPTRPWLEFGAALVYKDIKFAKQGRVDNVTPGNSFADKEVLAGQRYQLNGWDPMISMIYRF